MRVADESTCPIDFQTSLNLKNAIESWNKNTNLWLRSIVYERTGRNKIMYTYALSALWHGFYPGYYLTFTNGAFFTLAARSVSISPILRLSSLDYD
jgi:lysophospholipid acyltransferase 1/2